MGFCPIAFIQPVRAHTNKEGLLVSLEATVSFARCASSKNDRIHAMEKGRESHCFEDGALPGTQPGDVG